jgi:hypothetical protein
VLLALTCAALIWAGVAVAARAGNPIPGTFSGSYKVTIRVTNTKSTPSHWIFGAHPTCSSPCRAVSFRERLVSEKSWRKGTQTFRWSGKAYVVAKMLRKHADCVGKSGATVKKGYDVRSAERFRIHVVSGGRVTQWLGNGRDDYIPNAAGKAHHCTAGAYLYALKGVAQ